MKPVATIVTGHQAEVAAAEYLERLGYEICAMNWRRPNCEIDIVARKQNCLHFVEVKYRKQAGQGSGLEHITPVKLRRLWFAARVYAQFNGWRGDSNIAAIEVSGPSNEVTDFVETISYDV